MKKQVSEKSENQLIAGFKLSGIDKDKRVEYLEKLGKPQCRNIDVKTFGKFLQCIPIPGVQAKFVTLQG